MAKQTTGANGRKSRSAARVGPRYGRKSRKLVADMEEKTKASYD
jgi:large subunit ribosomal protein L37Ae